MTKKQFIQHLVNNYNLGKKRDQLEVAIQLCIYGHRNQERYNGSVYALHPIFLAINLHNHNAKIVALMHDLVEDTDFTLQDLEDIGFHSGIINAVSLLTKEKGAEWKLYIKKIASCDIATQVKLEDMKHNYPDAKSGNKSKYIWAIKELSPVLHMLSDDNIFDMMDSVDLY